MGGAVGAGGAEQVETARRVQAAAAVPAAAQAVVSMLHQSLTGPQDPAVAEHTHRLVHWSHTHTHTQERSEVKV